MGKRPLGLTGLIASGLCLFTLSACTTSNVTLAPKLPEHYQKLGPAQGEACSSVVIFAGAEQAIPIMVPSRLDRAYQAALKSVPGAVSVANVTMQDHWYWAGFGTVYCTTVTGEGIR